MNRRGGLLAATLVPIRGWLATRHIILAHGLKIGWGLEAMRCVSRLEEGHVLSRLYLFIFLLDVFIFSFILFIN